MASRIGKKNGKAKADDNQIPIEAIFPPKEIIITKGISPASPSAPAITEKDEKQDWRHSRAPQELNQLWRRCGIIPGEGGRDEPLYGEINCGGMHRIYAYLKKECGFCKDSVFMDIGSGLAKTVFHAAIDPGCRKSIGIEISDYRHESAVRLKDLLTRKYGYKFDNVELIHEDIQNITEFEATHVYAFFPRMDPKAFPYEHIADVFMKSPASQYMVCYTPPKKMAEYGYNVKTLEKLSVKQQGRGANFTVYIYRKLGANDVAPAVEEDIKAEAKVDSTAQQDKVDAKLQEKVVMATRTRAQRSAAQNITPKSK